MDQNSEQRKRFILVDGVYFNEPFFAVLSPTSPVNTFEYLIGSGSIWISFCSATGVYLIYSSNADGTETNVAKILFIN
jgi:hypothetical protein